MGLNTETYSMMTLFVEINAKKCCLPSFPRLVVADGQIGEVRSSITQTFHSLGALFFNFITFIVSYYYTATIWDTPLIVGLSCSSSFAFSSECPAACASPLG